MKKGKTKVKIAPPGRYKTRLPRRSLVFPLGLLIAMGLLAAALAVTLSSGSQQMCPRGQVWVQTGTVNDVPVFGCE